MLLKAALREENFTAFKNIMFKRIQLSDNANVRNKRLKEESDTRKDYIIKLLQYVDGFISDSEDTNTKEDISNYEMDNDETQVTRNLKRPYRQTVMDSQIKRRSRIILSDNSNDREYQQSRANNIK